MRPLLTYQSTQPTTSKASFTKLHFVFLVALFSYAISSGSQSLTLTTDTIEVIDSLEENEDKKSFQAEMQLDDDFLQETLIFPFNPFFEVIPVPASIIKETGYYAMCLLPPELLS